MLEKLTVYSMYFLFCLGNFACGQVRKRYCAINTATFPLAFPSNSAESSRSTVLNEKAHLGFSYIQRLQKNVIIFALKDLVLFLRNSLSATPNTVQATHIAIREMFSSLSKEFKKYGKSYLFPAEILNQHTSCWRFKFVVAAACGPINMSWWQHSP